MALIKCPECGKEISDKAAHCIHCGYPLEAGDKDKKDEKRYCKPKKLVDDVDNIGSQLTSWLGDCAQKCSYYGNGEGVFNMNYEGNTVLNLYENGIKILTNPHPLELIRIHKSQIISIYEYTAESLKNKSVIGRSLAGGLLLGPVGAVVGGMSGIGLKNSKTRFLIIVYWDVKRSERIALSFESKTPFMSFIQKTRKTF